MGKYLNIEIEKVNYTNKDYIFRHSFDVTDLQNSIKYEGLLYPPILLQKSESDFIIISGYRRLLACKGLEMKKVLCVVHQEGDLQKEELLKISIAENTKREPLKPVEIAEALLRIKDELHLSDEELAEQFGETFGIGTNVTNMAKYLKLNLFDADTKDFVLNLK